jgi:hypothetical protein
MADKSELGYRIAMTPYLRCSLWQILFVMLAAALLTGRIHAQGFDENGNLSWTIHNKDFWAGRYHAPGFDLGRGWEIIEGPSPAMDHATWLLALQQWREAKKAEIKYDGALYDRPELKWTQRNFIQPQMMVEDRYFYDPAT